MYFSSFVTATCIPFVVILIWPKVFLLLFNLFRLQNVFREHRHILTHMHICVCIQMYLGVCVFPPTTLILRKISWVTNVIFPCRNVNSSTLMSWINGFSFLFTFSCFSWFLYFKVRFCIQLWSFQQECLEVSFISTEIFYSVLLGRWFLVLILASLTSEISSSKPWDPLMSKLLDLVISKLCYHSTGIVSF